MINDTAIGIGLGLALYGLYELLRYLADVIIAMT